MDKVVIVAGGGHGIGEATAIELGRHGATVVVNDLGTDLTGEGESDDPATETLAAVEDAGGSGMVHFGDVTSLDYTESLVADCVEEYGRVDGIVNFAGILRDSISYKMSEDEWDDVVRVHLRGHFSLLRSVGAHWRDAAGDGRLEDQRSFLGVTSRSALGSVGQLNYSAAKAGVLGMMRTAAREYARFNVRVNAFMPTAFTRMIEDIPEEHRSFGPDDMPPEKVTPTVAYLMSDEAEDITGKTIRAAGDSVGVVSDPEVVRVGYRDGGWSLEELADRFKSDVAAGIDLNASDEVF